MKYISRETVEGYFGEKEEIDVKVLLERIEIDYGVTVRTRNIEWENPTKEQVFRMTKAISENEDIRRQIKTARDKRDPQNTAYVKSKDQFMSVVNGARNGR